MHNILITGANGQLGSELRALEFHYPSYNFIFTDLEQLDITACRAVEKYIEQNAITVIINCAAYTAVDKAETEPAGANAINHLAVENLAKISKSGGITLVHISTDYVFDGTSDKPYTEEDVPNPQNVYGKSKLAGEKAMQEVNPSNSIIIRTSWVYSSYGNNFVKNMIRLGKEKESLNVISDQRGSPTYARDLAKTILEILPKLKNEDVEIYHYSNEGVCSWYDFALTIFTLKEISIDVKPVETKDFFTVAKRPQFSVLNIGKIKNTFGIEIPRFKDSLEQCLLKINFESKIIQLPKILDPRGNLSYFENNNQIPFEIKTTYLLYDVPGGEILRGQSIKEHNELIVALSGSVDITVFNGKKEEKFSLNRSHFGLLIENGFWCQMENFVTNTVVLVVSNTKLNDNRIIRNNDNYGKQKHYEKDSI